MGPKQIEYLYINHKWTTRIPNALVFMFLGVCFKKMCDFVNFISNSIYMYFHQGFKNLYIKKMIYHHFKKNVLKIEIFCLLMFGGFVVKMDNFHLFEEVIKFLFHA